jgi:phosphocarrier protein
MSARAQVTVANARGLHARAAALFAKTAQGFAARVRVRKAELEVDGTSIMDLMMLAAGPGSALEIEADGADQEKALAALIALVEAHFHERG